MSLIDDKVNLLHDFVYSKNRENIKMSKINLDNITLQDIKITSKSDNYNDVITELFTGKMKEISYKKEHLVLKRYGEGLSIGIHISPYRDDEDVKK